LYLLGLLGYAAPDLFSTGIGEFVVVDSRKGERRAGMNSWISWNYSLSKSPFSSSFTFGAIAIFRVRL
jgi:hypothetical protein